MPLVRQTPTDIIVNISDKTEDGTTIKRKAELQSLTYSTKEKRVLIGLMIYPFAVGTPNEDGTTQYGKPLSGIAGFQPYYKQQIADMNTLVDAATGELLGESSMLNDSVANAEGGFLYGKNIMYEFEYYKMVAATAPVIIDDLIIGKIQQADALGNL